MSIHLLGFNLPARFGIFLVLILILMFPLNCTKNSPPAESTSSKNVTSAPTFLKGNSDRVFWTNLLVRIAHPVLMSLSENRLRQTMPVECDPQREQYARDVTHLEAFGRLMAGMAPWLELGPDTTAEGKLRAHYIKLAVKALKNGVDPKSPDFLNFTKHPQPLVDAAFLAQALIRAPKQIWGNLDAKSRKNLIQALKSTRIIKPYYNNWLLFSAMIEAALLKFSGEWDAMRVDYALRQMNNWYKGDGVYGDGRDFHFDYYNSYVIQPMMIDIVRTMQECGKHSPVSYQKIINRAKRYAEIQERLISPEGTFPPVGRSLPYRWGAFQVLAQMALMHQLPENLSPGQVRAALTAVMKKMSEAPDTFDGNGWLKIGFYGHQPSIAEYYIATGSLYLCSVGMLQLGLPGNDAFWQAPPEDWTAKKAWSGKPVETDHAYRE